MRTRRVVCFFPAASLMSGTVTDTQYTHRIKESHENTRVWLGVGQGRVHGVQALHTAKGKAMKQKQA